MTVRVFVLTALLGNPLAAVATDLQDALVDFVKVCATPRLEGSRPDLTRLNTHFVSQESDPSASKKEQGAASSFASKNGSPAYLLTIAADGTCQFSYDIPATMPFGGEFVLALHELKRKYYKGQMGPPAKPGSGLTAIWMVGPSATFDVIYQFHEKNGVRSVTVSTNK